MELHKFLEFGLFVVLLDPLTSFHLTIFTANQKFYNYGKAIKYMSLIMCMLLAPLLSPLIKWLAEISVISLARNRLSL